MKLSSVLLAGLLVALALSAEPLVVSFDRFHATSPTAEGGWLLYNELGCVNCHSGETGLPALRGPNLATVSQRVQGTWLRQFVADPSSMHVGVIMPQAWAQADAPTLIAIEHYLASLQPKTAVKPSRIMHVNAGRGNLLFHTLGCAACHAPAKGFVPAEGVPAEKDFSHRSLSFPDLAAKYSLASLAAYILDPLKVRPDGRMPKTEMLAQDADDLAGYLVNFTDSDGKLAPSIEALTLDKNLVIAGRKAVIAAQCAACHDLPKDVAAVPVGLSKAEGGCLASNHAKGPHYQLSAPQIASLKLYLSTARDKVADPASAVRLTLQALNCVACHERDGQGGPDAARQVYFKGDPNLGDTGRYPPPLTGIGRKLRPEWLEKVLLGQNRIRPYLLTKMPVYGAATKNLGVLLGRVDVKSEVVMPGGDDAAGRKLMGIQGGAGCITCHRWVDRPSLGIQGPDLSNIGQRLQLGWLREYLINPAAYRAGTLMPSFWPAGKSFNLGILGGDTDQQIASIYSFVKSDNGAPEGFPEFSKGEYEITPKDRPVVQRTFMEGVGVRAILVGFPTGVHLAFDGEKGVPALAWQGRFFDAYSTWFSRFPVFEKPPGKTIVAWPKATQGDFSGYRLDVAGNPTFITSQHGVAVEDHYQGFEQGLRRTITWQPKPDFAPTITHPAGVVISELPASQVSQRIFTYLWK